MKYVVICSIILLIVHIIPVHAVYELPTNEEKTLFDQLLSQFQTVNAPKKDVSDVIDTLQKTMLITFSCSPGDINSKIMIFVNTRLAKFDESTVHQDLVTGGSYTWHCSEDIQTGKGSLVCNNEIRINPKVISNDTQVDTRLHNIENLVILYHELLHGQLMIDAIKGSTLWQKETCNSQAGSDIDYSFADPDHKIINYLQTQFASELVDQEDGKMITKEISPDMTNNGTFTIKVLGFTDYPSFGSGAKITIRTNNISEDSFFQIKNDVFLSGHLKDITKSGIAWFYIFNSEKTRDMSEPVPTWIKRIAGLWSTQQGHD
ncbi:MAG: hypothetical protein KGH95_03580, partial [Thaumarchaeota archaeon]|nr:hypothetical protein [Nitrososphaerota archaeon]